VDRHDVGGWAGAAGRGCVEEASCRIEAEIVLGDGLSKSGLASDPRVEVRRVWCPNLVVGGGALGYWVQQ
jgi:hypothetical protein